MGSDPAAPEEITDVGKGTIEYIRRHPSYVVGSAIVVVFLEALLFIFHISGGASYFFPFVVPLVVYVGIRTKIQHEFMQQFAAANGFQYARKGNMDSLDGALFKIGHSRSVSDVMTGTESGRPLSIFTYKYTVGSGKSSQTYTNTVFETQFDVAMPDILLESK